MRNVWAMLFVAICPLLLINMHYCHYLFSIFHRCWKITISSWHIRLCTEAYRFLYTKLSHGNFETFRSFCKETMNLEDVLLNFYHVFFFELLHFVYYMSRFRKISSHPGGHWSNNTPGALDKVGRRLRFIKMWFCIAKAPSKLISSKWKKDPSRKLL